MPVIDGTSAIKAAAKSPIAKRAEEKLTTSAAAKVAGNAIGKKIIDAAGKVAPVASVALQSQMGPEATADDYELQTGKKRGKIPSVVEGNKPTMKEVFEENKNDNLLPDWLKDGETKVEQPSTRLDYEVKARPVVNKAAEASSSSSEDKKEEEKTDNGNEQPKEEKARLTQPEAEEVKEKAETKPSAPGTSGKKDNKGIDYHNIISYYRSGGYGDPSSSQAKRNMGFAILDQIGKTAKEISNIANATAGKAAVANTTSSFDREQADAQNLDYTTRRMKEELSNNKEMQAQMNSLQKDFTAWMDTHAMTAFGKDLNSMTEDEKEKAFKEYYAARGNQVARGSLQDWVEKALGYGLPILTAVGVGALKK